MSASYDFIAVPAEHGRRVLATLAGFLSQKGMRVIAPRMQTTQGRPTRFKTNKVIFISHATRRWIQIAAWPNELEIDFSSWHFRNPLALHLSTALSPVLFVWSVGGGRAGGYSIFEDGSLAESQSAGDFEQMRDPSFDHKNGACLARILNDGSFQFREVVRAVNGNLEMAIATIAHRLGCECHLVDLMDLLDGDGGMVIENGKYSPVSTAGWNALEFAKS
jgi:hypothetical protein